MRTKYLRLQHVLFEGYMSPGYFKPCCTKYFMAVWWCRAFQYAVLMQNLKFNFSWPYFPIAHYDRCLYSSRLA